MMQWLTCSEIIFFCTRYGYFHMLIQIDMQTNICLFIYSYVVHILT